MYDLLKFPKKRKNEVVRWTPQAEKTFEKSKQLLANATLLAYPEPNLPTSIHVDASDKAIGAVLQQQHSSTQKPIAYFSRKLDATQQRYSTFDRELLAAYKVIQHFHYLAEGLKLTLWSDHKPLVATFFSKNDQINAR